MSHVVSSQAENGCIVTSKCIKVINNVTPTRHETLVARENVDLTEFLSCRSTLFEYLRHNHISLRQVPMMRRQKPDLLLLKYVSKICGLNFEIAAIPRPCIRFCSFR